MVDTPLNLAISQSGIFYLSPAFRLVFNLANELRAKLKAQENKGPGPRDETESGQGGDEESTDQGLTDIEDEFLSTVESMEKELVLMTTMTPGRQNIEKLLIKTLEKFGSINYHIQQRGGLDLPQSPMDRGAPKH